MIDPLRRLRIFVAMAARLLPGVRCSTACTEYRSPSWRMVIPGRSCVARISFAPDAYGVLRQAAYEKLTNAVCGPRPLPRQSLARLNFATALRGPHDPDQ